MSKLKPFKELSKAGQTKRLNKYAAERAERGTERVLGRVVKTPKLNTIKNGAKQAVIRLAMYDAEENTTTFENFLAYISSDKANDPDNNLVAYYKGLAQGDLVSIEFKKNGQYNNAYSVFTEKTRAQELAEKATDPVVEQPEDQMIEV